MLISTDLSRCVSEDLKKPFQWFALGIFFFFFCQSLLLLDLQFFCALNMDKQIAYFFLFSGAQITAFRILDKC